MIAQKDNMSDEKVAKRLLAAWKIAKPGEAIPYEAAYIMTSDEMQITPEERMTAAQLLQNYSIIAGRVTSRR